MSGRQIIFERAHKHAYILSWQGLLNTGSYKLLGKVGRFSHDCPSNETTGRTQGESGNLTQPFEKHFYFAKVRID